LLSQTSEKPPERRLSIRLRPEMKKLQGKTDVNHSAQVRTNRH
jgi:hypothetical protein